MNLPIEFAQTMTEYLGKEEYHQLAEALSCPAPTSVRINSKKAKQEELEILKDTNKVPWCEDGFYLKTRPQFTFDPLFHAGCYYVQEASSMFLSHLLKLYVNKPVVALDLCAAPGGKSTLTLSQLPEGSLLIANEVIRQRANILAENICKWGYSNCIVTNNHTEDFQHFTDTFDLIICDAPCSGEGMFRKDANSISEWSLAHVETCWKRQRDIARNIWGSLKENGLFIYSTCTYNPHEDEETVAWIAHELGAEILSCHPQPEWKLTDKNIHFFPHKTQGEGFFISILRKKGQENAPSPKDMLKGRKNSSLKSKPKRNSATKTPPEIRKWITDNSLFTFFETKGAFRAFPSIHFPLLQQTTNLLKVLHSGILLATIKGKNLQPTQNLALCNNLSLECFPTAEVELPQAIAYLRTEAIQLPSNIPTGYVLITYQNHPLGFAKNIGNRANNLYPPEWKIKSTHVPY